MSRNDSSPNTTTDILLAGAFAAFTVDLLIYPLDTLKTRLQSASHSSASSIPLRGLYQGVGSVIIATLPSSGAFFLTYESSKSLLSPLSSFGIPAPFIHATASGAAELVSCAILTPAETIKSNAQVAAKASSTLQTLKHFQQHPARLFHGYRALAARNLPFTALQFPMFEALKTKLRHRRKAQGVWSGTVTEQTLLTAGSAGLAGGIAAVVTTPVDVVKTRVMLAAGKDKTQTKVQSEWSVGKDVWKAQGVRGLFKGGSLRGIWTMLGSALYLSMYDLGKFWLGRRSH